MDQRLKEYIQMTLDSGFSPQRVKQVLLEAGWPEEMVAEAIQEHSVPAASPLLNSKSNAWLSVAVLLLVTAVFLLPTGQEFAITGHATKSLDSAVAAKTVTVIEQQDSAPVPVVEPEPEPEPEPEVETRQERKVIVKSLHAPKHKAPNTVLLETTEYQVDDCQKMEAGEERDKCFMDVAVDDNEKGVCGRIRSEEMHSLCIEKIALLNQRPAMCTETMNSDMCYYKYAFQFKEADVCNKITNRDVADLCKEKAKA